MRKVLGFVLLVALTGVTACGEDGSGGSDGDGGSATTGGASSSDGGSTSGGSNGDGGGSSGNPGTGGGEAYGTEHDGVFWIGPVDFEETEWHNACSPAGRKYSQTVRDAYGDFLMGIDNRSFDQDCDRCVELTANGVTAIAHVITYGEDTGPDDIDVSPSLNEYLLNGNANANQVNWKLVTCPANGTAYYEFDGRDWSNTWYFRVWVRNTVLPYGKVEARLTASDSWSECEWQSDGAFQCTGADFSNGFQIRVTSLDGTKTLEDTIAGIGTFDYNEPTASHGNLE